ncbi:MAG: LysM peptidoglycan-binding domain-containing protein [Flavobacteriales bacterium]|nr:LysM peptidoglycan-binding domain-containing protein [Flavobacteriales bacterium]
MRARVALFLTLTAFGAQAQTLWRLDSLVATWPVRAALEEARHSSRPGVIRAMDTRDIYRKLRAAVPELPVFADSLVARLVDELGEPRREDLRALLGIAEEYYPLIDGELTRHGLPRDLRYLPLALSAMNTLHGNSEGGGGLWSLTYPVAMRYGLSVSADLDERRDPRLCTMAAMRYLKDLHARYADWPMTVAAFACGPANLTRARQRTSGSSDLRMLYPHFTSGSRDVLPMWMAMTYLATHAEQLGIALIHVRPFEPADTIRAPQELRLTALAVALGIPKERLQALNPVLFGDRVPAFHALLLPAGERSRYTALTDSVQHLQQWLAEAERKASEPGEDAVAKGPEGREAVYYRVRSGDYLGRIAQRFGVKVSQLKTWNRMKSDHIDVGEELVIWVTPAHRTRFEKEKEKSEEGDEPVNQNAPKTDEASVKAPAQRKAAEAAKTETSKEESGFTWYTVRKGDSLYVIAKRYPGVDADSLMRVNRIGPGIRPGQRIKVPVKP